MRIRNQTCGKLKTTPTSGRRQTALTIVTREVELPSAGGVIALPRVLGSPPLLRQVCRVTANEFFTKTVGEHRKNSSLTDVDFAAARSSWG